MRWFELNWQWAALNIKFRFVSVVQLWRVQTDAIFCKISLISNRVWWLEVSWRPCESSSTTIKLFTSLEETKQPWTAESWSWTPEQQHKEDTEKHLSHSLNLHFSQLTDAVIQSVVRMWSIILHYLLSGSSHVTAVCQQCVEVLLISWRPQWNKKRKKPQQQAEWIHTCSCGSLWCDRHVDPLWAASNHWTSNHNITRLP